ncbi:MAG: SDR family NAD(P)-dependent oxidoreductase [Myxococcota bacterium]|nr:SDR family NAD(P)-dependent oxidoreductase [Myxococcota bacterium]
MVILIPGATGGFGRVLGEHLAAAGMTVYGTSRSPDAHRADLSFPLLRLDVTEAESPTACVGELLEREGRIDVLINCTNEMMIGAVEEQTVDEVRALYDTNVFGALALYQAVLPAMRERGAGAIITMSSLGGLLAVPYMSAYTSAKFALEALTEALYHELRGSGIDVVIMQPVAMAMDRPATGAHLHTVENTAPDSPSHRMVERMAKDTAASKLTPERVAKEVERVIHMDRKPLRVPLDRAKPLSVIKRLAPQALIDRLVGGLLDDTAPAKGG